MATLRNPFKRNLSLILITGLIIATTAPLSPASAAGWDLVEAQITPGNSIDYELTFFAVPQFPSVDGDRVVWKDDRNGNSDIYMYEVSTDTETRITTDVNDQIWPSISEDIIVWMDDRSGDWDIYMYDLGTDTESQVTDNNFDQAEPCISGDRIVWEDYRDIGEGPVRYLGRSLSTGIGDNTNIYMYDLGTDTESALIDEASTQYSPWIDGNIVVWEDYRTASTATVYEYDFGTPVEDGSPVSASGYDQYWPIINNNHIVWTEDQDEGTSYDVYLYDRAGAQEYQITDDPGMQVFGWYDSNTIVWSDNRDTDWNVYIYNAEVGAEAPLITHEKNQGVARLDTGLLVWGDARNDSGDAGLADLFFGGLLWDDESPVFNELVEGGVINIDNGDTIITDPFTIEVRPSDNTEIEEVRFYAGDTLLCTDRSADENGVYSCEWNTGDVCETEIRIVAYDIHNNSTELLRTVEISGDICPRLAETGSGIGPLVLVGSTALPIAIAILSRQVYIIHRRKHSGKSACP